MASMACYPSEKAGQKSEKEETRGVAEATSEGEDEIPAAAAGKPQGKISQGRGEKTPQPHQGKTEPATSPASILGSTVKHLRFGEPDESATAATLQVRAR